MRKIVCDFVVSSVDREVEDLTNFSVGHTDEMLESFINRLVREGQLTVGEKCEGGVYVHGDSLIIEYRYCESLGDDWGDDVWEDMELKLNRRLYGF